MTNKTKVLRRIDIIFWVIIMINAIIEIIKGIKNGSINLGLDGVTLDMLGIKEFFIMVIFIGVMFLFFTVISLLKMMYLTIIYIGFRIAYNKYSKEKLEQIDFKNDTYYRDIISNYSPAELSYIDDFKLEEKDIVATLMSLELKQKIKIGDNIHLINESEEGLEENEKYVFNNIKNNTLKDINLIAFEEVVKKDALKNELLEEKKNIKKTILKKILTCSLVYFAIIIGFIKFPEIFNKLPTDQDIILVIMLVTMLVLFFAMIIFPYSMIVYIKSYSLMNEINPYVRSKKAKGINIKLEGLKKYIKEYTLLDKKEYKEIVMWENYLIFAVMFGQNNNIVDKIMKKIKQN